MPWLILHIESDRQHCEAIEATMLATGAAAVTLQDSADQPLFEPDPGATPLWQQLCISGLYEAGTDMDRVLAALAGDVPVARHRVEILEDKDWVRSWMDSYHPLAMGQRLWICPSWLESPQADAVNLILDPGLAFGTGTHPTTAMCLRWLDGQDLTGKTVTDYGCGSGILAIAALLLGAEYATATDIDPQAIVASRDNARRNGLDDRRLRLCLPGELGNDAATDIVLANILAGPLTTLAPKISALVRPGGRLILSGILAEQASMVIAAYPDFRFESPQEQEGWVLLLARKQPPDTRVV